MPLLSALADIGYTGRCSIECHWADLASEAPRAAETVRRTAERAGLECHLARAFEGRWFDPMAQWRLL
jgi:hypothetical protein